MKDNIFVPLITEPYAFGEEYIGQLSSELTVFLKEGIEALKKGEKGMMGVNWLVTKANTYFSILTAAVEAWRASKAKFLCFDTDTPTPSNYERMAAENHSRICAHWQGIGDDISRGVFRNIILLKQLTDKADEKPEKVFHEDRFPAKGVRIYPDKEVNYA